MNPASIHPLVYVAGHQGMVGSAIVRSLQAKGYDNVLTGSRDELDLLDQQAVHAFLGRHKPDYIFIAAAKVGGIHANNTLRADFMAFFGVVALCMMIGAWRRNGDLLLVPAALMGTAVTVRAIALGLDVRNRDFNATRLIELVDRLSAAGFPNIEAASFVSPKWVPQMAT